MGKCKNNIISISVNEAKEYLNFITNIRVVNTSIIETMKMSYDEKIISQDIYYGFCGPMMGFIYPEEISQ